MSVQSINYANVTPARVANANLAKSRNVSFSSNNQDEFKPQGQPKADIQKKQNALNNALVCLMLALTGFTAMRNESKLAEILAKLK